MKKNNYSIKKDKNIEDALKCIELNELGLIFIEDRKKIIGVVTDGDIRRAVLEKSYDSTADAMMTRIPVTIAGDERLSRVLEVMENPGRKVYALPVTDAEGVLLGVIRMHDIVGS